MPRSTLRYGCTTVNKTDEWEYKKYTHNQDYLSKINGGLDNDKYWEKNRAEKRTRKYNDIEVVILNWLAREGITEMTFSVKT